MTDNVHYLPSYEPPMAPAPRLIRVRLDLPEPAPTPAVTPLGVLLAVVVSVATYAAVVALLG